MSKIQIYSTAVRTVTRYSENLKKLQDKSIRNDVQSSGWPAKITETLTKKKLYQEKN